MTTRAQRHQDRKRRGVVLASIEIQPAITQSLVEWGLLKESETHDKDKIAEVIEFVMSLFVEGELAFDLGDSG